MAPDGESNATNSVRDAMVSQHPGIVDEIEGAIKTLHKLKGIAGSGVHDRRPADAGEGIVQPFAATAALTAVGANATGAPTGQFARTEIEPRAVAEVPILACGSSFGRYQVVRLLGRGAMGAVYLAYDTQLHRHIALKTPLLDPNTQVIERFFREARAAAQLRSPYTCPIYDAGQIGHIYYLSMAFIEGQPLTHAIAEGRLRTTAEITGLIKKIAQGLQKAHDLGIIHRDLKPDNIMIDHDGEPIVMDFGLARRVDDEAQVTLSGVIIGTPAYMSPEQVEGDPKKIGPSTDIYSLGVILYQMLTGRLPFKGSLTAILRQIGNDIPPSPATLNNDLGEDSLLEHVCIRMMAKTPEERFASMAEVAKVLETSCPYPQTPIVKPSRLSRVKSWSSGIFASLARPVAGTKIVETSSLDKPVVDAGHETIVNP